VRRHYTSARNGHWEIAIRDRARTAVRRYVLPKLYAMYFALEGVLDGGVNESQGLDAHGKTLAFASRSL
jgi:hypothetical protein